jgi:hypothetical protein
VYINNIIMNYCDSIAATFNKYFLSLADSIIDNIKSDKNKYMIIANLLDCLSLCFKHPFPKLKWSYTSRYVIEKIIKSPTTTTNGYDEIPVKILKLSVSIIVSPLANIGNKVTFFQSFS